MPISSDLTGRTVVVHTCNADLHGDHEACVCSLIGQKVVIAGMLDSVCQGERSYRIQDRTKWVQASEVMTVFDR